MGNCICKSLITKRADCPVHSKPIDKECAESEYYSFISARGTSVEPQEPREEFRECMGYCTDCLMRCHNRFIGDPGTGVRQEAIKAKEEAGKVRDTKEWRRELHKLQNDLYGGYYKETEDFISNLLDKQKKQILSDIDKELKRIGFKINNDYK